MNDEQHRLALFQPLPGGLGLICRLAALPLTRVVLLHHIRAALPTDKWASGSLVQVVLAGPVGASVPRKVKPEKVIDMNTSSNVAVAPKKLAPPLFASPWLALFSAFKNGWRRSPAKPSSRKTH